MNLATEKMKSQIENSFTYHAPTGEQIPKYKELRDQARELAHKINDLCPNSREKSLAITKLEETIMWANKSIACNEMAPDDEQK